MGGKDARPSEGATLRGGECLTSNIRRKGFPESGDSTCSFCSKSITFWEVLSVLHFRKPDALALRRHNTAGMISPWWRLSHMLTSCTNSPADEYLFNPAAFKDPACQNVLFEACNLMSWFQRQSLERAGQVLLRGQSVARGPGAAQAHPV